MTPYDLYRTYIGLKLHFGRWEHNSRTSRASYEAFSTRSDKFQFERLAEKTVPVWRIVSTLVRGDAYIRDVNSLESGELSMQALGRVESLSRVLREEIPRLKPGFLEADPGKHPDLAMGIMGKRISRETGSVLLRLPGVAKSWKERYASDPVMMDLTLRVYRYYPFLSVNEKKVSEVLQELLS